VTLTVEDVSAAGYVYDPASNVEDYDQITINVR